MILLEKINLSLLTIHIFFEYTNILCIERLLLTYLFEINIYSLMYINYFIIKFLIQICI